MTLFRINRKVLVSIVVFSFVLIISACGGTEDTTSNQNVDSGEKDIQKFKLGHPVAAETVSGITALSFSEGVKEQTDNEIQIDVYEGGQLGSEISMLEQVQSGSLDMASVSLAPLSNFVSELKVLD